jgi:hypothetical protein
MITNQVLANESKSGNGQEPINKQRRILMGGALAALLVSPLSIMADDGEDKDTEAPNDPFIVLLSGIYQPVLAGQGPESNLGLTKVNLNDGSYSTTQIHPVFGIEGRGEHKHKKKAIGTFYVQFGGKLCAYDLPGGAIAMSFNDVPAGAPPGFNGLVPFPDGHKGFFLEGTFELMIIEATGVYGAFEGGHNHMVDKLHQLANGHFDEFCFCNISTYQFP